MVYCSAEDLSNLFHSEDFIEWIAPKLPLFKIDLPRIERTLQAYCISYLLKKLSSENSEFHDELICAETPYYDGSFPDICFLDPRDRKSPRIWIEIKEFYDKDIVVSDVEDDLKKMESLPLAKLQKVMLVLSTNPGLREDEFKILGERYPTTKIEVIDLGK
jgi:hypothetical protein